MVAYGEGNMFLYFLFNAYMLKRCSNLIGELAGWSIAALPIY